MKQFSNYQHVEGEPMNERDKQEVGSKFWNKGKWDNFVLPFLPDDCSELTLIDMGCNAGVFLNLAEKKGFKKVVGVESNRDALRKATAYKERINADFEIFSAAMEDSLDLLPVSDYMVMAMAHYYIPISKWYDFLDQVHAKALNVIIVTAEKREKVFKAEADTESIRSYFEDWKETGYIPELPMDGDPFPRRQWSFCFQSPTLERVAIDDLELIHDVGDLYEELDSGIDLEETKYCKALKESKKNNKRWNEKRILKRLRNKKAVYDDVKENGLKKPLVVDPKNLVLDGNHRLAMLKHLGHKYVLIRRAA